MCRNLPAPLRLAMAKAAEESAKLTAKKKEFEMQQAEEGRKAADKAKAEAGHGHGFGQRYAAAPEWRLQQMD